MFGTGHPATHEAQAIARIRKLSSVLVVGRDPSRTDASIGKLRSMGLPAEAEESPEAAVRVADIIVTATTATAPIFDAVWDQPGTHVSSMGSDA